jgi:DNA invertase Pin-like site-specific DNA recombinase
MQDVLTGQEWVIDMINTSLIKVYTSMAEQEGTTILKRQREGIDIAKFKGKHLVRPVITFPKD